MKCVVVTVLFCAFLAFEANCTIKFSGQNSSNFLKCLAHKPDTVCLPGFSLEKILPLWNCHVCKVILAPGASCHHLSVSEVCPFQCSKNICTTPDTIFEETIIPGADIDIHVEPAAEEVKIQGLDIVSGIDQIVGGLEKLSPVVPINEGVASPVYPINEVAVEKISPVAPTNVGSVDQLPSVAPTNIGSVDQLPSVASVNADISPVYPNNEGVVENLSPVYPINEVAVENISPVAATNVGSVDQLPSVASVNADSVDVLSSATSATPVEQESPVMVQYRN